MVTLRAMFDEACAALAAAGIAEPREEARHLIGGLFSLSLGGLTLEGARLLDDDELARARGAVIRRAAGEPVYRILGAREFYGLDFALGPETLEPRPDTEILVEEALTEMRQIVAMRGAVRFADLGTGTGAIAITLLTQCLQAHAVVSDISQSALEMAQRNALVHKVTERFETRCGSWYAPLDGPFDMIVSNPPYIRTDEIERLQPEVRDHDPRAALDGGDDGLDAYRAIAAGAGKFLVPGGIVALEIGYDQKAPVVAIFETAGFALKRAIRDLGGNDRVVIFKPAR
ncbi:peptide chain release factor N(5)-glutamine methyltransferase [Martelella alba]|uniref:Release factor glutamine methyltransferase n=1 Tax=Martelella alba TaxID=2590451 RepID=A0A506UFI0_9HYPH|nr:peptide chain release factor N(5)-glutamine methyltransferase [Martelella alba]TPW32316.1 peptide chain release factor N(5)-glutamine methyltransferase [Martelella alba]